jgi:hypothetical protein
MAVLSRAAALACLAACYSPDVRDCSVTCASSADCAGAQICGADHFCAMPEIAGTCAHQQAMPDAATPDAGDAGVTPPVDAAPPDAPATGALHLKVGGHGQLLAGGHTCTMDCTFQVPLVTIDVVAVGLAGQELDKWTEGPCAGSHATTCTVIAPVTVGAKFHKDDDH